MHQATDAWIMGALPFPPPPHPPTHLSPFPNTHAHAHTKQHIPDITSHHIQHTLGPCLPCSLWGGESSCGHNATHSKTQQYPRPRCGIIPSQQDHAFRILQPLGRSSPSPCAGHATVAVLLPPQPSPACTSVTWPPRVLRIVRSATGNAHQGRREQGRGGSRGGCYGRSPG